MCVSCEREREKRFPQSVGESSVQAGQKRRIRQFLNYCQCFLGGCKGQAREKWLQYSYSTDCVCVEGERAFLHSNKALQMYNNWEFCSIIYKIKLNLPIIFSLYIKTKVKKCTSTSTMLSRRKGVRLITHFTLPRVGITGIKCRIIERRIYQLCNRYSCGCVCVCENNRRGVNKEVVAVVVVYLTVWE